MKVLYSCLSQSWGGMEMFTLTAIKQLLRRNINIEFLCYAESRLHVEANNIGLVIHPIKVSGYIHPYGTLKTASILKRNKYDLIHTQYSKDLWLIVPALNLLKNKTPLLLTKHMGSFIIKKDFLHKLIYKRLDYAIAISHVIQKNLWETTPLTEDKILLLHDGVDTGKITPEKGCSTKIKEEFGIKENDIVIGMLARISPGKGHEELLTAAKILNEKHENLIFLIVGGASRGEDEYAARIKKTAEDYNLTNAIFSDFRTDTVDVLSAFDIFVFPSHAEAFGISLVEAMAMEKPSVCSNSDGILDIAVDNYTSLLFEKKNAGDLVEKIEKLILSPDLRSILGKNARKRAVEKFDIEIVTDKVLEIYRKVVINNKEKISSE